MSPAAATTAAAAAATAAADIKLYARKTSRTRLTTAFVVPTSCDDAFFPAFTSIRTPSTWETQITTEWQLLASSEDGCRPWDTSYTTRGNGPESYDPAVCPSGWTAYGLGASTGWKVKPKDVYFTGTCCPSGYSVSYFQSGGPDCARSVPPNSTTRTGPADDDDGPGRTITTALRYANPWFITWKESDASTLDPKPPALTPTCTNQQLSSWVPGSPVAAPLPCYTYNRQEGDSTDGEVRLFEFLVIGLPIIVVCLCISCCVCCCVNHRRKRRRLLQQAKGPEGYAMDHTVGLSVEEQQTAREQQTAGDRDTPHEQQISREQQTSLEQQTTSAPQSQLSTSRVGEAAAPERHPTGLVRETADTKADISL